MNACAPSSSASPPMRNRADVGSREPGGIRRPPHWLSTRSSPPPPISVQATRRSSAPVGRLISARGGAASTGVGGRGGARGSTLSTGATAAAGDSANSLSGRGPPPQSSCGTRVARGLPAPSLCGREMGRVWEAGGHSSPNARPSHTNTAPTTATTISSRTVSNARPLSEVYRSYYGQIRRCRQDNERPPRQRIDTHTVAWLLDKPPGRVNI